MLQANALRVARSFAKRHSWLKRSIRDASLYLGEEKTDKAAPETAVDFMFSKSRALCSRSLSPERRSEEEEEHGCLERSEHRTRLSRGRNSSTFGFEINPDDSPASRTLSAETESGCATRATFPTDVSGDDEAKKCQAQAKIETSGYSGAGMANARHLARDSAARTLARVFRSEKREGITRRRREGDIAIGSKCATGTPLSLPCMHGVSPPSLPFWNSKLSLCYRDEPIHRFTA